jgi:hypothetical protein
MPLRSTLEVTVVVASVDADATVALGCVAAVSAGGGADVDGTDVAVGAAAGVPQAANEMTASIGNTLLSIFFLLSTRFGD